MPTDLVTKSLQWLGFQARDRVTGFQGAVTSVCFDLYGCVQVCISPPAEGAKLEQGYWFDVKRLEQMGENRVMNPSSLTLNYGEENGPSHKPASQQMPAR